ncbi:Serine protease precursor MucD/AlgY associated with sigma factor RpoE [Minicystis rosea]|nr:Serine protease precursor MucD/AlgY associated with sigma factor RpoE [Minicystis rosea]
MRHASSIGLALLLAAAGCAVLDVDEPEAGPDAGEPIAPAVMSPSLAPVPLDDALSPFEHAVGEQMEAVAKITVEVQAWEGSELASHGSGVFVSADGDVLTAAHVVKDKARIHRVVLPNGQSRIAEVVARDEAHDAALLRAIGAPTPFVRLPAHPRPLGEWVVCAGHAGTVADDRVPTRSAGVIVERAYTWITWERRQSTTWREALVKGPTHHGMLRVDCATAPGMSGGPIVTLDGELVGVVVGSHGIASPIEAIRHLLPAASRAPIAAETIPRASLPSAPAPVSGADGRPSRAAAFHPLFASTGAERSVVELEIMRPLVRHFPAVLVSSTGLAVVPAVRVTSLAQPGDTVPPESISVMGHPDARCTEIVAVRGELALIRLSGLVAAEGEEGAAPANGLRPVGPAGAVATGAIIAAVNGTAQRSTGFVTAVERRPGSVAPPAPPVLRGGCGHRSTMFHQAFPAVIVSAALAHDADMPEYGSLLVDRHGRPVALEVASRAEGVDFAVPWSDVVGRFEAWMGRSSPPVNRGDE